MSKIAYKSFYPVIIGLILTVSKTVSTCIANDEDTRDTVELKNGDSLTGTLLNDTLTVTTPYTAITLEKDKISEIRINSESEDHDVIALKEGGLLEGTIEEQSYSFQPVSGKIISIKKEDCKKIVLK